jgi:hypothetical protein
MSPVKANRGAAQGLSHEAARLHLVCGHLKVRRSGIVWWSPFPGGSGTTLARRGYSVRS